MEATYTNRLSRETSPYLLQHQHNPVDWWPWHADAFRRAAEQNKPIFLSVGYSTCYWCHVMERQCFENPDIARLMNEQFINIKVDREERPDVDQLYMTALQVLTRQGGWPMSIWLLPDRRPFFAGTYFPPSDAHGRPGFPSILEGIADAYANRRDEVEKTAGQMVNVLEELARPAATDEAVQLTPEWVGVLITRCVDDYEPKYGGFGAAPKFPRETLLDLLLTALRSAIITDEQKAEIRPMLKHALDAMADGGIRDHLGGAFHRYSTDAKWLVPHFEIMLYDNALLGRIYAEASVALNEPRYADVARRVFDFCLAEMTSKDGLFYTAFDAEVDAREGQNYLWTMAQVEQVITDPRQAARFAKVYGLSQGPNFADPHHGPDTPDQNVLFLAEPAAENDADIVAMREQLYAARQLRKKPLLDDKVITAWNALMITALSRAGKILNEPRYVAAATKAAGNLWHEHRYENGTLARSSRKHVLRHDGMLEDYAFLAEALKEMNLMEAAFHLVDALRDRFEDHADGAFFYSDRQLDDLVVRQKVAADSPLPSGNATAALVCDALGFHETAARALAAFAVQTNHHAPSMCSTLAAMLVFIEQHGPLRVLPTAGETARLATPAESAEGAVRISPEWADATTLKVTLAIDPGTHLTAATLELHAVDTALAGLHLPPPVRKQYPYADGPVGVYEGTVVLTVRLHQPLMEGDSVKLSLTYQACTESACLPTVTRVIEA